jgi:hypothetical protein
MNDSVSSPQRGLFRFTLAGLQMVAGAIAFSLELGGNR